jgi:two-component system, chemotaxis family, protein-glutamate methylesterase/glutaminase
MKPKPIRVLVVDDSVVVRQLIIDALKADSEIEIAAVAENGRAALQQLDHLQVDVILLDLEMPEMGGMALLDALKQRGSRVPSIVFSTLTERGAAAALEALSRGASDYVCKPSGQKSMAATLARIRDELIPRVHALASKARPSPVRIAPRRSGGPPSRPIGASQSERPAIVVVGVSTGGPTALAEVVMGLPTDLAVPVLVVQHMPALFTKALAQRLGEGSRVRVCEASHQQLLHGGTVYLAPGDFHMRIKGSAREAWITLDKEPKENGCRPAVDPLFKSAAAIYGAQVLALVLTGVGSDGLRGATEVRKAGGQIWVQDRSTCAASGMPSAIIDAGLCDRELLLNGISAALTRALRAGPRTVFPERKE